MSKRDNDEFFEEGSAVNDKSTFIEFCEKHETAIEVGAGILLAALLLRGKKRRVAARQEANGRAAIAYNTGYLEGQKDAYRDVAKHKNRNNNHRGNRNGH